jgi:hypothetical protein
MKIAMSRNIVTESWTTTTVIDTGSGRENGEDGTDETDLVSISLRKCMYLTCGRLLFAPEDLLVCACIVSQRSTHTHFSFFIFHLSDS